MKTLRLSPEYLASPIFCPDVDHMGHIDEKELPISEALKADLLNWDVEYQDTFDASYPPDSGFQTPELAEAHQKKGAELARRLQAELGEGFLVEYKP